MFYPCIYCNYSGKICVIVGPKSSYEDARSLLEMQYPSEWKNCDAIPQPATMQGLRHKRKYEKARLALCIVENAWDLANSRLALAETHNARAWALNEFNKSAKEFALAYWEDTKAVNTLEDVVQICTAGTQVELQAKMLMYGRLVME